MSTQPPLNLPDVDETTGRGKRIRATEKNFGMTCVDTMGRQAEHVPDHNAVRNVPVEMDAYLKKFANQGTD